MVNITHTSGILPLYPIIFIIYECIVSPSSQMSNRFTVCKVSQRKVSRKEVRFEIPLTANKNEITMQTFLLHYCKRDVSRSAQLLLCECDLTHCRKTEYLKPLVSSLLLQFSSHPVLYHFNFCMFYADYGCLPFLYSITQAIVSRYKGHDRSRERVWHRE